MNETGNERAGEKERRGEGVFCGNPRAASVARFCYRRGKSVSFRLNPRRFTSWRRCKESGRRRREKRASEGKGKRAGNLSRGVTARGGFARVSPARLFILECFVRLRKCNYGLPAGIDYRIRLSRRLIGFLNSGDLNGNVFGWRGRRE